MRSRHASHAASDCSYSAACCASAGCSRHGGRCRDRWRRSRRHIRVRAAACAGREAGRRRRASGSIARRSRTRSSRGSCSEHPEWRRDRVARAVRGRRSTSRTGSPRPSPAQRFARQPVVHVSWFAASAYCEARGARLPTWYEWEYAAAASETAPDARRDRRWRQHDPRRGTRDPRARRLPNVGSTPANYYGVQDLHGVVWEWVDDFERDARLRRQPPAERSGRAALLRPRRAHDGAEGELRDADAHRDAVEHAGALHERDDGLPVRDDGGQTHESICCWRCC